MLFVFLSFFSGCGTLDTEPGPKKLNYLSARFFDMMDILELNMGVDSQVSLYAVASVEPFAVGGGLYDGEKLGMDGRLFGQWSEKRMEIDLAIEGFVRYNKTPNAGNSYLRDAFYSPHSNTLSTDDAFYKDWGLSPRYDDHEKRILDITAEVHLIALGIDVGISPVETLDFITGLFGIDVICNDDWASPIIMKREIPFKAPNPDDEATIPMDEK